MRPSKSEHLRRAKALLAAGDETSLRYCCLELRFCIELLAYELVPLYEEELPRDFDKWRPQDVIEALLDCNSDADKGYTLMMGQEGPDGSPPKKMHIVGRFKGLTRKFVQRHYHKLGSYLHAPTVAQTRTGKRAGPDRPFLEKTIAAVEALCSSTVRSNFGMKVSLKCQDCGKPITRRTESLKRDGKLTCLEPICKAEYTVEDLDSETPRFQMVQIHFECGSCKSKTYVGVHRLREGLRIKCTGCPQVFVFDQAWRIRRMEDVA